MKSSLAFGFVLVFSLTLFGGCRGTVDPFPTDSDPVATVGIGTAEEPVSKSHNRGIDAQGTFTWQDVELVSPDGSTSEASFRANYVVLGRGRAAGSFAFFNAEGIVVYRITGGEVSCVGGTDVVVLNATAVGPDNQTIGDVTVEVTPAGGDNPACIIWDIKDSCSHEAAGKHNVIDSACGR